MRATLGIQDLEARLAADADGRVREDLQAALSAEADSLRRQLDAGVPPADFTRLTRAREAFTCAADVLGKLAKRLKT